MDSFSELIENDVVRLTGRKFDAKVSLRMLFKKDFSAKLLRLNKIYFLHDKFIENLKNASLMIGTLAERQIFLTL